MDITISVFINDEEKGVRQVSTPCILGRSKEATLTISHPSISRKHCELYEDSGYLMIRDNASLNGIGYKGEIITRPVVLLPNEFFTIGEIVFLVDYKTPEKEQSLFSIDNDDESGVIDLASLPDTKAAIAPQVPPPAKKPKPKLDDDIFVAEIVD